MLFIPLPNQPYYISHHVSCVEIIYVLQTIYVVSSLQNKKEVTIVNAIPKTFSINIIQPSLVSSPYKKPHEISGSGGVISQNSTPLNLTSSSTSISSINTSPVKTSKTVT